LWCGRKKGNSGVLLFYTSIDPRPKWKIYSFEKVETEEGIQIDEGVADSSFPSNSLLKIYFKE
jgi:hypothetical protein